MNSSIHRAPRLYFSCLLCLLTGAAVAHDKDRDDHFGRQAYDNHVLVSNGGVPADFTDANLVNGWGVAFNPFGVVWITDNHTGKSTLYDGAGKPQALVVTIPGVGGGVGSPTGIVYSGGSDFVVSNGTVSAPARFIFASEDGLITAWAGATGTTAIIKADNSGAGAKYKGLAIGGNGTTHLLYAADFHNSRVDVFDGNFAPVSLPAGAFVDPRLPHGYAPFGIQALNGDIYVTYAKQDDDAEDEVAGPGFGFVDIYSPDGTFVDRLVSRGLLNAPWGLALAPASFGQFGGALLVGNFGDGAINAFDPVSGGLLGTLRDTNHRRIHIDGLWGFAFGNGLSGQKTNALYYAAGPNDENDGSYGVITAVED